MTFMGGFVYTQLVNTLLTCAGYICSSASERTSAQAMWGGGRRGLNAFYLR